MMRRPYFIAVAVALLVAAVAGSAAALPGLGQAMAPGQEQQRAGDALAPLQNVGITQRLGESVPMDLVFHDESGKEVRLGDLFGGKKPIVMVMTYYECPMLCTVVLNGMVKAFRPINLNVGEDFDVIAVSFNPKDTPELATTKKENYLKSYGRDGAAAGWHFLTGQEPAIHAITDAVGFAYRYIPETGEFAHAAGIMVLTPQGRISHYFYGIEYSSRDLRLALVEAAGGKIGNLVDEMMLYCFRYDPTAGKYSAAALSIVRLGGIVTILALAGFIGASRIREMRTARARS
ncbi:MAG: SCO family protein [Deltaproteobacteria bacterium]|nr:SCO family protein [Deltaproteobacteria bacterium]